MNRFARTTFWYTVAGLLGPVVALGLTPIYTRAIGVSGYGTVDVLLTLWQGAYTVALWGMATVLAGIYTGTADEDRQQRIVLSVGVAVVLLSCGVGAAVYPLAPWIAAITERPEAIVALPYLVGALPFAVVYTMLLQVFRLRSDIRRTVVTMLTLVVVTAATRIGMVVVAGWGVVGMIQAAALTQVVMACVTVLLGWRLIGRRLDGHIVEQYYRTGLPLFPVSIASWVLLYADRWLLAPQVSPLALGQYALGVLVASLLAFAIEPLKNAWQPIALRNNRHEDERFLATSYRLYESVALLVGAGVVLGAPSLLWIIGGADAQAAARYVLPLASMPVLGGVQVLVGIRAVHHGRTPTFGVSGVSAAVVNLVLNLLLIPTYGVMGAAWATAAAAMTGTLALAWAERQTIRQMQVGAGLWLVCAWGVGLAWWGNVGAGWGIGVVLLCLVTVTIFRAWPAVKAWRSLGSSIDP
ncbi:MAG: hypothetical protein RLY87_2795 [Chloroflexota bacterium]